MANQPEINQKNKYRKKIVVVIGCVVLIGVAAYFVVAHVQNNKVNCSQETTKATQLLRQKNYSQAYNRLESDAKVCSSATTTSTPQKTQNPKTQTQTVQYDNSLASAAYFSGGHSQQALQYADQAIAIYNAMSPEQQQQIPNYQQIVQQLVLIKTQESINQSPNDSNQ